MFHARQCCTGNLWGVIFRLEGNILCAVLPYCIFNCSMLALVELSHQEIGFSPTGHGLLTLLISFLVISKVNLAYERYMLARQSVGDAFQHLRELVQLIIAVSVGIQDDDQRTVSNWRSEAVQQIVQIVDATRVVAQNETIAQYLARNESCAEFTKENDRNREDVKDPLALVHTLRLHLYTADVGLELLERVSLINKFSEYITDYRRILSLASTPIPIPLVQIGRAALFLWTFSMPLVLRQGPFTDLFTAEVFLFFLTYGFIGLELVSMRLSYPFGDGSQEINVSGLRDATVIGIQHDLDGTGTLTLSQRRLQLRNQISMNNIERSNKAMAEQHPYSIEEYPDTSAYHAIL